MAQRVMLELERGDPATAAALCRARSPRWPPRWPTGASPRWRPRSRRSPGARWRSPGAPRLERAIAALGAVDAKAMLAYVLNSAAAQDLGAGDLGGRGRAPPAALAAAASWCRRSEIAVARALLGRDALARGDRGRRRGAPRGGARGTARRRSGSRSGPSPRSTRSPTRWRCDRPSSPPGAGEARPVIEKGDPHAVSDRRIQLRSPAHRRAAQQGQRFPQALSRRARHPSPAHASSPPIAAAASASSRRPTPRPFARPFTRRA